MGLWLGCSVFSIVELLELTLDGLVLFCCKVVNRQHKVFSRKQTKTQVTPGHGPRTFERTIRLNRRMTVRRDLVLSEM